MKKTHSYFMTILLFFSLSQFGFTMDKVAGYLPFLFSYSSNENNTASGGNDDSNNGPFVCYEQDSSDGKFKDNSEITLILRGDSVDEVIKNKDGTKVTKFFNGTKLIINDKDEEYFQDNDGNQKKVLRPENILAAKQSELDEVVRNLGDYHCTWVK